MRDVGEQIEGFEGAFSGRSYSIPAEWNELTHRVIGCAMRVQTSLGVGLPERIYAAALEHALKKAMIRFDREFRVDVRYDGVVVGDLRIDLVVEGFLVLELKGVESVHDAHLAQLVGYLRAANLPLGLLINFHALRLKDGIYRRLHAPALPKSNPIPTSV